MKNFEVVNNLNNLDKLGEMVFPIKIAYAIKKNLKALMGEYEIYYETLKDLKKNNDEESQEFKKELSDLLDLDTDIDIIKIKKEDLLNSDINISIKDLNFLDFMIS